VAKVISKTNNEEYLQDELDDFRDKFTGLSAKELDEYIKYKQLECLYSINTTLYNINTTLKKIDNRVGIILGIILLNIAIGFILAIIL